MMIHRICVDLTMVYKFLLNNCSALYVYCWTHCLNLIITDAVNLLGIIETKYDFICSYKNSVLLFEKHQKLLYPDKCITKKIEITRWMSHSYTLNNVLDIILLFLRHWKSS